MLSTFESLMEPVNMNIKIPFAGGRVNAILTLIILHFLVNIFNLGFLQFDKVGSEIDRIGNVKNSLDASIESNNGDDENRPFHDSKENSKRTAQDADTVLQLHYSIWLLRLFSRSMG